MKLHTKAIAVAAAAALTAATAHAVAPEQPQPIYREGEVLVKFRPGTSATQVQDAKARLGLVAKRAVGRGRLTELLALPRFTTTAGALEVLRGDPAVELAEPNFRRLPRAAVPDDDLFDQQWGLQNTGQPNFVDGSPGAVGGDLNMVNAWDADGDGTADRTGDAAVILAVIDDAIQIDHPDLAANVVLAHNFISCQDADDPSPVTAGGQHGTLVSGSATARGDNGIGVAGVAWNASLMPLKFGFDSASHMEAFEYARDNGAKIINASFGGPGFSQIEADAIAALAGDDILYVAAAGNDDSNTDVAELNYPANYDADNIVSVAATNRSDDIASFSQYGPLTADVAAPGLQIVTTAITSEYSTGGVSGTSFSSPYTAGVAALLKSHVMPQPDFMEMKARLIESGTALPGANPKLMTAGGRVDAAAALDMAPRPALVLTDVAFTDGGNGALDPGEMLTVTFSVRNLWMNAANVAATLAVDDPDITVDTVGPVAMGAIASLATDTVDFQITVPGGITEHRYVDLTLTLTADGGYTAARNTRAELGALVVDAGPVSQPFDGSIYDDFHAWHVDVPDGTGKTLFIRTSTPNGQDIDLLAKRDVPPQYNITVGINPETQFGFFCTSGTAPGCQDPATLLSARLDGVEEISVVDPPAGTYHLVLVNFEQQSTALDYTLEAVLADGDLRPSGFDFVNQSGVPANTTVTSNSVAVGGITPGLSTRITVAGGEYSVGAEPFTTQPGTVMANNTVRLRANSGPSASARVQVTIGGVTDSWFVNPQSGGGGGGGGSETNCEFEPSPRADGGGLPPAALALLGLAALARRLRRA